MSCKFFLLFSSFIPLCLCLSGVVVYLCNVHSHPSVRIRRLRSSSTWPAFSWGSSTWSAWCCSLDTGRDVFNSWCPCSRDSPPTRGWPSTNYRLVAAGSFSLPSRITSIVGLYSRIMSCTNKSSPRFFFFSWKSSTGGARGWQMIYYTTHYTAYTLDMRHHYSCLKLVAL